MSATPKPPAASPASKVEKDDLAELRTAHLQLDREVLILKGKISNSDPAELKKLEAVIAEQEIRITKLTHALYVLLNEAAQPKSAEEARNNTEDLRLAAVEYFQDKQINRDLWKNVES